MYISLYDLNKILLKPREENITSPFLPKRFTRKLLFPVITFQEEIVIEISSNKRG